MPPRKNYKKKATKKRSSRPRKSFKRPTDSNTARVVQTLEQLDILANQPYTLAVNGIIGDRALAHAEQYGLYRISKIEFKHKPKYDTYISQTITNPGANAITTVPSLYWKMNRYADAPAGFDADNLRSMGAKPHRLDDKIYTLSYKPNVLLGTISAGNNSGQLKMTPWLNTDSAPDTPGFIASTTSHLGHFLFVEADLINTTTQPIVATMDVVIHYEFKTPRVKWGGSSNVSSYSVNPLQITH